MQMTQVRYYLIRHGLRRATVSRCMIATGNHWYFDSLRGQLPRGEGYILPCRVRRAIKDRPYDVYRTCRRGDQWSPAGNCVQFPDFPKENRIGGYDAFVGAGDHNGLQSTDDRLAAM